MYVCVAKYINKDMNIYIYIYTQLEELGGDKMAVTNSRSSVGSFGDATDACR